MVPICLYTNPVYL